MTDVFGTFAVIAALLASDPADSSRLAEIRPAPAVELTRADGSTFRLADLRGKAVMVSFVFTTCNGTCPATTHTLYRVQKALEEAGIWGDQVEFVSITLDPANDTPQVLGRYADLYGVDRDRWHFLTGSDAQIGAVLKGWDMWARRAPDGQLDHPSRIFLVDPRGQIREIYNLGFLQVPAVMEDIRAVLREVKGG